MTEPPRSSGQRLAAISAVLEIASGLGFLLAPALVVPLLLRGPQPSELVTVLGRCFGIAILALGLACFPSREPGGVGSGAIPALVLYNALIAAFLAYVAVGLQLAGPLLWPAVAGHAVLAVLLVVTRRPRPAGRDRPAVRP